MGPSGPDTNSETDLDVDVGDDIRHRSIRSICERLRRSFDGARTRSLAWREAQLRGLERLLREGGADILSAVHGDLRKGSLEAWTSEIALVLSEARRARKRLRRWSRRRRVPTPLWLQPGRSFVVPEPLGVVLIIGPWNYPVQLVLAPLVGAIAAGNCAVIKPGEMASSTSTLLSRSLPRYLDPECFAVVEGGPDVTTDLLEQPFDHVFFTGGSTVARIVLAAAAPRLTPVTLELGGKSPCIVDQTADLNVAARRIAWGKFMNAGQTCVAPDHVYVHSSRADELRELLDTAITSFYGKDPRESADYGRIINERHFQRLVSMIEDGTLARGGEHDAGDLYIAPTVLRDVPEESRLWTDEIFGPILPVAEYEDLDALLARLRDAPKPLALYLFSKSTTTQAKVLDRTSSGGVCINDVVNHLMVPDLPFGGVGASGSGAYHGRSSFETFSHRKSVLKRSLRPDWLFRYPPYDEKALKWIRRLFGG